MSYVTTERFYWLVPQLVETNYRVLCTVKAEKASKNIQESTLPSFITISSIDYAWTKRVVILILAPW